MRANPNPPPAAPPAIAATFVLCLGGEVSVGASASVVDGSLVAVGEMVLDVLVALVMVVPPLA